MRKATVVDERQLDFFSIFEMEIEEMNQEIESLTLVKQDALSPNKAEEVVSPINVITEVLRQEIAKQPVPKGYILHQVVQHSDTEIHAFDEDFSPEHDGVLYNWTPEHTEMLYRRVMEESFNQIQMMIHDKKLWVQHPSGLRVINPVLKFELDWYCSENFKLVCQVFGLNAEEMQTNIRGLIYDATHSKNGMRDRYSKYRNDKKIIFHSTLDGTGWPIFFDDDYSMSNQTLPLRWSDADIVNVYTFLFEESMAKFENYVTTNKLIFRDDKGRGYLNPELERDINWFNSKPFEIIAKHLGYNVESVRKQIAACINLMLY
ncbi:TPA: hypothetical protein ACQZK0_004511 [Enterobacter mori]